MFHRLRERVLQALDENARAAGSLLEQTTSLPSPQARCQGGNGACLAPTPVYIWSGTTWRHQATENED